ncbi:hypothetical protein PB1_11704 [Bacillus methanolicus PB1]|uniref:Phosphoglycerate mutase n=1 Tax=Bacillus methanolicus PB1 TaxID=997296 RepID=I3DVF2_BACMT|nr:histidine phosphatase family protein [Bacillus methanolicus]EIJ78223.1 hypothetical protein PB1_11704 [Bacillus methanolicus PB1]
MKIGLVRHFKVIRGYPEKKIISQKELFQWIEEYETSDIEDGTVDLGGIEWTKCYSSDVHRAVKTAQQIFSGEIVKMKELREIPMYPLFNRNMKLPFLMWAILVRTAWLINHKSQLETKYDVEKRINSVLDLIMQSQNENILIVGHGAFLMMMSKELLKRGFIGKKITRPENGKLYIFEKI